MGVALWWSKEVGVAQCGGARKWVWHCVVEQGSGCGTVRWSKDVGVALCGRARKWVWHCVVDQ